MDNVLISPDTLLSASAESLEHAADRGPVALHWYDLTCPFCYLGQARTRLLKEHGLTVVELPFQAHPDTSPEGTFLGQRQGSMYARIEQAAAEIGLAGRRPDDPRLHLRSGIRACRCLGARNEQ
jgi:predicted DsbA family dithiol-disulfide isomerase